MITRTSADGDVLYDSASKGLAQKGQESSYSRWTNLNVCVCVRACTFAPAHALVWRTIVYIGLLYLLPIVRPL